MWFIKRNTNGASLGSLIPKILPFFTKRDGIMDRWTDRQTDNPNVICPQIFQIRGIKMKHYEIYRICQNMFLMDWDPRRASWSTLNLHHM